MSGKFSYDPVNLCIVLRGWFKIKVFRLSFHIMPAEAEKTENVESGKQNDCSRHIFTVRAISISKRGDNAIISA